MDASQEFTYYRSSAPDCRNGLSGAASVKQRIVPVINKVFSPSAFMRAQRKTSVYRAMSGVSFQDIDVADKKKQDKKAKKKKKADSSSPASENGGSQMSLKSERSVLSTSSIRSALSSRSDKSNSSCDRVSSSGPSWMSEKISDRLQKLGLSGRLRSSARTRSTSTVESCTSGSSVALSGHRNIYDTGSGEPPVRPTRSRSASRSRLLSTKINSDLSAAELLRVSCAALGSTHTAIKVTSPVVPDKNTEVSQYNEVRDQDVLTNNDQSDIVKPQRKARSRDKNREGRERRTSRQRDVDKHERKRSQSRSKTDFEVSVKKITDSVCALTYAKDIDERKDSEVEPEGGYFSLEKDGSGSEIKLAYEAQMGSEIDNENENSVDTIYVCQVFKPGDDQDSETDNRSYENYRVIRMNSEGKMIENSDNYENCRIIQQVKEAEMLRTTGQEVEESAGLDDAYEPIEFVNSAKRDDIKSKIVYSHSFHEQRQKYLERSEAQKDYLRSNAEKDTSVTVMTLRESERQQAIESPENNNISQSSQQRWHNRRRNTKKDFIKESTVDSDNEDCAGLVTVNVVDSKEHLREQSTQPFPAFYQSHFLSCDIRPATLNENRIDRMTISSVSEDNIAQQGDFDSLPASDSELENLDYNLFLPRSKSFSKTRDGELLLRRRRRHGPLSKTRRRHRSPEPELNDGTRPLSILQQLRSAGGGTVGSSLQHLRESLNLSSDDETDQSESRFEVLQIREPQDWILPTSRECVPSSSSIQEGQSFSSWSDADSNFEFVNMTKVEQPKIPLKSRRRPQRSSERRQTLTSIHHSAVEAALTESRRPQQHSVSRAESLKVIGERVTCRSEAKLRPYVPNAAPQVESWN